MQEIQHWWVFLAITVLGMGLALALVPLAAKIGVIDHPEERKVHEDPTPLTGGPAIYLALFSLLAWHFIDEVFIQGLLMGGTLIFLAGLADDRKHLSPTIRVTTQITACLIMMFHGGVILDHLGRLFSDDLIGLGVFRIPITLFAAIGVINAFNMVDGLDGLSGMIFLVAAGGMALFAGAAGADIIYYLLIASIAVVVGFFLVNARWPWNPKARAFLGDSGSTLLGFILVWCFIALGSSHNEIGNRVYMPMTAVWLFAVPLMDTTSLILHRFRDGRSPFLADQHHLHHAFLRAGFTTGDTWGWITFLTVSLAVVGIIFELKDLPDYFSFWTFIGFAVIYLLYMRKAWKTHRFLGRAFVG